MIYTWDNPEHEIYYKIYMHIWPGIPTIIQIKHESYVHIRANIRPHTLMPELAQPNRYAYGRCTTYPKILISIAH